MNAASTMHSSAQVLPGGSAVRAAVPAAAPESEMDALLLGRTRELVVSTPSQRNWRGILIALLVIMVVLGLILCAIMLLMPNDEGPRVKGRLFTLDAVNSGQFTPSLFNGTWVTEKDLVFMDMFGGLTLFCVTNLSTRQLMTNLTFRRINAEDYKVSADKNFVLLMSDIVKYWDYSFKAKYNIYDVANQETVPLTLEEMDPDDIELPAFEAVTWTPTGNGVAFVYNNNIYYKPYVRKKQEYKLTSDGETDVIFNGRPDFLYETMIFKQGSALWFSPDSNLLLYGHFNCSKVGKFHYSHYGNNIYHEIRTVRLPRPGTKITQIRLNVVDLKSPKILKVTYVKPPSMINKTGEYYVTGVQWINNKDISVIWMNRRQNFTAISICKNPDYICNIVHSEPPSSTSSSSKSYWVETIPNPIFDLARNRYVTILPFSEGPKGTFHHAWQLNMTSRKYKPLTQGPITVFEVCAWDLENHLVYVMVSQEPSKRYLYSASDANASSLMECLTCGKSENTSGLFEPSNGTFELNLLSHEPQCAYAKIYFNSRLNPKFYVLDCLGPEVPTSVVVELATNLIVYVLDTNSELRKVFGKMAKPQIKTISVEIENDHKAQVRLFLPPGLREHEDMTFPLILHVNSAPSSQLVTDQFHVDWWWYLAGKRNFIVAQIDARGTGGQGDRLVHEIFHRIGSFFIKGLFETKELGTVEVEDQIVVTSYLKTIFKFIDKQRIAIYGEGHGAFVTISTLIKDLDNVFKCGVAVNPITSFQLTDAFTTERYMGTPNSTDNYNGYHQADLSNQVTPLKSKDFLLISSTAGIKVPFQHSMKLVHALVGAGIQYKHQIYPDIGDDLTPVSDHLHSLIDAFWDECFQPLETFDWETMASFTPFSKE